MSSLVDSIIEQGRYDEPPVPLTGGPMEGLTRSSCLIPEVHFQRLINFFHEVSENDYFLLFLIINDAKNILFKL